MRDVDFAGPGGGHRLGFGWYRAGDEDRPRFGDGDLLGGDLLDGVTEVLGVLPGNPGEHGDRAVRCVGGVEPATQTHLDHPDVNRLRGKPGEGGEGGELEVGRLLTSLGGPHVDETRRHR